MEMTIDEAINTLEYIKNNPTNDADAQLPPEGIELFDTAINTMRKYQMMQADYNARLQADIVAVLTEIQLEIEELDTPNNSDAYMTCSELIQQKINALKGDSDGA